MLLPLWGKVGIGVTLTCGETVTLYTPFFKITFRTDKQSSMRLIDLPLNINSQRK